jgi:hypothetical protein
MKHFQNLLFIFVFILLNFLNRFVENSKIDIQGLSIKVSIKRIIFP